MITSFIFNGLNGLYTSGIGKTIMNNTMVGNDQAAILFENPVNAIITNNTFVSNNIAGLTYSEIDMISSGIGDNNLIEGNLFQPYLVSSINLTWVHNTIIRNNKFRGLGVGSNLFLVESDNTTIKENEFVVSGTAMNIS